MPDQKVLRQNRRFLPLSGQKDASFLLRASSNGNILGVKKFRGIYIMLKMRYYQSPESTMTGLRTLPVRFLVLSLSLQRRQMILWHVFIIQEKECLSSLINLQNPGGSITLSHSKMLLAYSSLVLLKSLWLIRLVL